MLRASKSLRRDYPAMMGMALILVGIFVLGGIVYTYSNRSSGLIGATTQLRQLPSDL
jgi:hypothetical protein